MESRRKYFDSALSDFVYDMAGGAEIRHLADAGYSVEQIFERLGGSISKERIGQTVCQYMLEAGLILAVLPIDEKEMKEERLKNISRHTLSKALREHIDRNGEENSYVLVPFGEWIMRGMSCLTKREQEYILGIKCENDIMYHRLNTRMLEIGTELSLSTDYEMKYYFLSERTVLIVP